MSKRRVEVYEDNYPKHPINASREQVEPCDKKILDKIEECFNDEQEKHSKMMAFRYDVRIPKSIDNIDANRLFIKGQADIVKHLTRQGVDPRYVAVREKSGNGKDHYHVMVLVNAHKTQNPHGHLTKAEEIFERKLGLEPNGKHGIVNFCDKDQDGKTARNFYIVHRGNNAEFDEAFKRASYLARCHTKTDDGRREMFASVRRKKKDG